MDIMDTNRIVGLDGQVLMGWSGTSIFFSANCSASTIFQVAEVAQDMVRIEGLNGFDIQIEILDQVLHDANDLFVDFQQIGLMVLVGLVIHELVQSILEVGHAVQGRHGVGSLEAFVFHGHDATDVLQLGIRPHHHAFDSNIILDGCCHGSTCV